MPALTIGAFARATRLSPKALRLYDEVGLLRPAAVDPESGYRRYDPGQVDRARLIAWLRRIGMPLARIREVCDLPPARAAAQVAGFWAEVNADIAARGRLVTLLIEYLSEGGNAMPEPTEKLAIRYAARAESGLVRTSNEDVAYAGAGLLAVADGMRGPGGDRASAAAVDALKPLATRPVPADDLLGALADAVAQADQAIHDIATDNAKEVATTLTALLWSGSRLALVHIGDTRAYQLRAGQLFQITTDHTHVQSLVEQGQLTVEEAATHPQRALLVRALTGSGTSQPDLSLHTPAPGDRYLLCSDGLSAVVPPDRLHQVLAADGGPQPVLDRLIELAYVAGAPDNIACVVADVVAG